MLGRFEKQRKEAPQTSDQNKSRGRGFGIANLRAWVSLFLMVALVFGWLSGPLTVQAFAHPTRKAPGTTPGTIAYIRNETELRLI